MTTRNLTRRCRRCNGSGREQDDTALGVQMTQERLNARLTQRQVATAMAVSHGYVAMLETGRKHWSEQRVEAYRAALGRLTR